MGSVGACAIGGGFVDTSEGTGAVTGGAPGAFAGLCVLQTHIQGGCLGGGESERRPVESEAEAFFGSASSPSMVRSSPPSDPDRLSQKALPLPIPAFS